MCGLVGIVATDPSVLARIGAMTDAIRHRGPDDEGYLLASTGDGTARLARGLDSHAEAQGTPLSQVGPLVENVAFGHRRLSILDLSVGGHQPMRSRSGRFWITYNGEIYNYLELRRDLEALGCSFTTVSDTEVLLAAWETWGETCLSRLNGMWALAILDVRERRVVLSRDRFGEKPLYYRHDGETFAFSSEMTALRAGGFLRGVDEASLASYLAHGVIEEGERTFFEEVRRVPPGGLLSFDIARREITISRWYTLPEDGPRGLDAEGFASLLDDAIRIRRRSDVPVGTCLSGGLDSSAITALSARQLETPADYHAFSAVYPDAGISEAPFVQAAVSRIGVRSHIVTPNGESLRRDLSDFVLNQGEPVPSLGPYTQYAVSREARAQGVKVLLDGQGADELLGGYHYQAGPFLADVWRGRGIRALAREARGLAPNMARSPLWLAGLAMYQRFPMPSFVESFVRARASTYAGLPETALVPSFASLGRAGEKHRAGVTFDEERRRALSMSSLPALLRYEDRNTMRFAVEARLPFLDHRLVAAALSLDGATLFKGGWTKSILRDAVSPLLPDSIVRRRDKLGFATPDARLWRETWPLPLEILEADGTLDGRLERGFVRSELDRGLAAVDRPFFTRWCLAALWLRGAGSSG